MPLKKKTKLGVWLHYYPLAVVNGCCEKCLNKQFEMVNLKACYLPGSVMAGKHSFIALKSVPTIFITRMSL